MSASSAINITGLAATSDGDIKILENVGATFAVTLTHDDVASAAGNRIAASNNLVLDPGQACVLIYGATSARWHLVSTGMMPATSAQATALSDAGVAITPSVLGAGIKGNYPASSGRKFLATPADGTSGDYTGRALAPTDMPYGLRAAAFFTVSGSAITAQSGFNCTISRTGGGLFTATVSNAFADTNYVATGMAEHASSGNAMTVQRQTGGTKSTTVFQFVTMTAGAGSGDPASCSIVFFGN